VPARAESKYPVLAAAGAVVGALEGIVIAPADIGKIRLQAYQPPGKPEEFVRGCAS